MSQKQHKGKHLTISQRIIIEKGLTDHDSFSAIAKRIEKDPSTVSKEVRNHLIESVLPARENDIPCVHSRGCKIKNLFDTSVPVLHQVQMYFIVAKMYSHLAFLI